MIKIQDSKSDPKAQIFVPLRYCSCDCVKTSKNMAMDFVLGFEADQNNQGIDEVITIIIIMYD